MSGQNNYHGYWFENFFSYIIHCILTLLDKWYGKKRKITLLVQTVNKKCFVDVRDNCFLFAQWNIVVANVVFFSQDKCIQYWPDAVDEPMVVDHYRLTMTKEKEHTSYVYRLITISNNTDTVIIKTWFYQT